MTDKLFHWIAGAVMAASILHMFLPPWDADVFEDFPSFQRYYKLLIYVIGYIALNARSTVYASKISLEKQVSTGVAHTFSKKKAEDAIAAQKISEPDSDFKKGDK